MGMLAIYKVTLRCGAESQIRITKGMDLMDDQREDARNKVLLCYSI